MLFCPSLTRSERFLQIDQLIIRLQVVVVTNFIRMLMRNVFMNVSKSDAVIWWAAIFCIRVVVRVGVWVCVGVCGCVCVVCGVVWCVWCLRVCGVCVCVCVSVCVSVCAVASLFKAPGPQSWLGARTSIGSQERGYPSRTPM